MGFFIAAGVFLLTLLNGWYRWFVGGWSTLEKFYRAKESANQEAYVHCYGVHVYRKPYFFGGHYLLMKVCLGDEGLRISPRFSSMISEILIPWSKILKVSSRWNESGVEISVKDFSGVVVFGMGYFMIPSFTVQALKDRISKAG